MMTKQEKGALKLGVAALVIGLLTYPAFASYPETREYMLGDIDDFNYDGAGSVDDVYVDPDFWTWSLPHTYAHGIQGFDYLSNDYGALFTWVFSLAPNEQVIAASLTVRMRALHSLVTNDRIDLEPTRGARSDTFFRYDFADLGWLPITTTGGDTRTIDLGNAFGCYDHTTVADNLLPLLQDGKFNVMVHDDVAIDYATLTVEVIPEPATLALLALGAAALLMRRRH